MSKPAESSFTEYVIHAALSSSDSDLFVCYSVLPGNAQDAPSSCVMSSVQSFRYSVAVRGHTSALYCTYVTWINLENNMFIISSLGMERLPGSMDGASDTLFNAVALPNV